MQRIAYAALGAIAAGALVWFLRPPIEIPAEPLPPEIRERIVPVEVVKEIPGPVQVVERVRVVTETVEVPVETIREVERVVEVAAETGELQARVGLDADKWSGSDAVGWFGEAWCRIRSGDDQPWLEIARAPFSVEESVAVTEAPARPAPSRALEVRLGLAVSGDQTGWSAGVTAYRSGRFGWWGQFAQLGDDSSLSGGAAVRLGRR